MMMKHTIPKVIYKFLCTVILQVIYKIITNINNGLIAAQHVCPTSYKVSTIIHIGGAYQLEICSNDSVII